MKLQGSSRRFDFNQASFALPAGVGPYLECYSSYGLRLLAGCFYSKALVEVRPQSFTMFYPGGVV